MKIRKQLKRLIQKSINISEGNYTHVSIDKHGAIVKSEIDGLTVKSQHVCVVPLPSYLDMIDSYTFNRHEIEKRSMQQKMLRKVREMAKEYNSPAWKYFAIDDTGAVNAYRAEIALSTGSMKTWYYNDEGLPVGDWYRYLGVIDLEDLDKSKIHKFKWTHAEVFGDHP